MSKVTQKTESEKALLAIVLRNYTSFDIMEKYVNNIREKVLELLSELPKEEGIASAYYHCKVINKFLDMLQKEIKEATEDIARP